jgi:mannose-1-phosphate guanylyltransferase/phosphomannomutase
MAGGEGTRLRPLTCGRPKPMMPVVNKPMMEHIVNLLKEHDINSIGVTLQYLPGHIRDYFGSGAEYGVHMRYYVEDTPLGTAGSVQNAREFLDETFVVISGDCLTDFDIGKAVEFHRQKGALATLVLTRVECPLEYGVVITDRDNRIVKFLEKPGWGEVFSDTVNTGIYILEPEVLNFFEPGRKFDFSQDLFPLLLKEKQPLFGAVLEGYWCDIGDLKAYAQAHQDVLTGKVKVNIPAVEKTPGVWVGRDVAIDESVQIQGPVLIGNRCSISGDVTLGQYTVLGDGCVIRNRASIKRSILWGGVFVGSGAALRGAVLCSRVQVQNNSGVYEGAVLGSDTVVREDSLIKPDVKLWPQKVIESGTVVQGSMVWGTRYPKKIFGIEGITGLVNVEVTPDFALRIAAAFASVNGSGNGLVVSCDGCPASGMIKSAVTSGIQSAGVRVFELGCGITPLNRYTVRSMKLDGGIHVKMSSRKKDCVTMVFMDNKGANISRGNERKVENAQMREDYNRADLTRVEPVQAAEKAREYYMAALSDTIGGNIVSSGGITLVAAYQQNNMGSFIEPLAEGFNIELVNMMEGEENGRPGDGISRTVRSWQEYRNLLPQLAAEVVRRSAFAGALIEPNGDGLVLVDEGGRAIGDDLLTALSALVVLKSRSGPVIVPVTASGTIDELARRYQGKVVRTKTSMQDFAEKVMGGEDSREQTGISQFILNFDALGALFSIIEFAVSNRLTIGQLVDEIPEFFMHRSKGISSSGLGAGFT